MSATASEDQCGTEPSSHVAHDSGRALSQRELMLAGSRFMTPDLGLARMHLRAQKLVRTFNTCAPGDSHTQQSVLKNLLEHIGNDSWIEPSFHCDYGVHIHLGDNVFINMNCTFLDAHRITLGNRVYVSPNVQFLTVQHPLCAAERSLLVEDRIHCVQQASPVRIGNDVWIGAGAIILPGVEIGDGCTVGAGSVVTRSLAPHTVAAGNPCKPLRPHD
jgi:acetyltransferase-like isoleucine patch superfamily enzyme